MSTGCRQSRACRVLGLVANSKLAASSFLLEQRSTTRWSPPRRLLSGRMFQSQEAEFTLAVLELHQEVCLELFTMRVNSFLMERSIDGPEEGFCEQPQSGNSDS